MANIEASRALFGIFPSYTASPLPVNFDRVLNAGDSSGLQSPLSFGPNPRTFKPKTRTFRGWGVLGLGKQGGGAKHETRNPGKRTGQVRPGPECRRLLRAPVASLLRSVRVQGLLLCCNSFRVQESTSPVGPRTPE